MSFQAKKLINDPNDVVTEFIEGLVETYPGLQYLDGFPEVKVVLRADISSGTYDKVAIISGGGSGHEPAHAGYVGEGMLTAAICGDVFASPPVDSILAGIRAVTGHMGCLLIVKNYTGDRLNFGLAAEQAKSEGFKVETVIVGDDCALPPPRGIAGRRGLAGTILVHKVAGAAAAAGLSLAEVAAEAKRASELVGTMGVALSVCTLPGQVMSDRLGPGKMELGLGIHGEPGAAVADLQPVDIVVSHVLKQILSTETHYVPITRGSRVVLMVNGLGATPVMELIIASGKAVPQLQLEHGLAVDRVYTGSFMTSLDMAGFSITIMKADEATLQRLDAPTKAPCWPAGVDGYRPPPKIPVPVTPSRFKKNAEVLGKKKAIDELIRSAISQKDHLTSFQPFRHYDRKGLSVYLESGSGDKLSSPVKQYIQKLLKVNMEGHYGPEWPIEEKVKRREMVATEARYIFVRESPKLSYDVTPSKILGKDGCVLWTGEGDPLVGFVHYRFIVEEEIPVVYVYELQLESCVQGKGLGKFLMQLIELIALKNHMGAVMLTVQKANRSAMHFYMNKLRYVISVISPSRVDPLIGAEMSYEILCKSFDFQAKAKLEESGYTGDE